MIIGECDSFTQTISDKHFTRHLLSPTYREGLEEQRMWQEAEKILEVEAREAEYKVRREVEEAKREAEDKEAELKRAKVTVKDPPV